MALPSPRYTVDLSEQFPDTAGAQEMRHASLPRISSGVIQRWGECPSHPQRGFCATRRPSRQQTDGIHRWPFCGQNMPPTPVIFLTVTFLQATS